MNSIERYKQLEKQIKWVKKQIDQQYYAGAGISIDLCIGDWANESNPDCSMSFTFGIYSGIEKQLLELILKGLIETQKYVLMDIQKDFEEITKLLETI